MSDKKPLVYVKTVLLSLGLGAIACGLPSIGGDQTGVGVAPTDVPPASPTATSFQVEQPPATQSSGPASGACENTYYPVVPGATWAYDVTGGPEGPTSYTDIISSMEGDSFVLTTTFGDLTRTQRWSCNADGLVALEFGGGSATVAVSGIQAVFDTTQVTGVTLPADPSPGDSWSQTFTLEGSQTLSGNQTAEVEGKVDYAMTAVELESVSVQAGTFQALRIEGTSSMDLTVQMSGFTVPMTISGTIVRWYAPDVGYVRSVEKSDVLGNPVEVTTELTSYTIP